MEKKTGTLAYMEHACASKMCKLKEKCMKGCVQY